MIRHASIFEWTFVDEAPSHREFAIIGIPGFVDLLIEADVGYACTIDVPIRQKVTKSHTLCDTTTLHHHLSSRRFGHA